MKLPVQDLQKGIRMLILFKKLFITLILTVFLLLIIQLYSQDEYNVYVSKINTDVPKRLSHSNRSITSNSNPVVSNTAELANTELQEKKVDGQAVDKTGSNLAPVSFISKYRGEFSLDLHSQSGVSIGSKINLILPDENYQLVVSDIYPDDDRLIYEFDGEDGSDSLLIYFPESGNSYVRIETRTMSFESHLNSNGVGEFYNVREALVNKDIIYTTNDYIIPDADDQVR